MFDKLTKYERWKKRRARRSEETIASPRFAKFKKGDLVRRRWLGGKNCLQDAHIKKLLGTGFVVKVVQGEPQILDVHWQGIGGKKEECASVIEHLNEPSVEKVTLPKDSK